MRKLLALAATLVLLALFTSAIASGSKRTAKVGDDYLSPGKLTISRGTLVTWRWQGTTDEEHNVRDLKHRFGSKTQMAGVFRYRFRKAGKYTVVCTIHPTAMREKIVVK